MSCTTLFSVDGMLLPCPPSLHAIMYQSFHVRHASSWERGSQYLRERITNGELFDPVGAFKKVDLAHGRFKLLATPSWFGDVILTHLSRGLDIDEMSTIIIAADERCPNIDVNNNATIVERMLRYVEMVGADTFTWRVLSEKMEYSFYQLRKRNWPVSKRNNISWQLMALKIGLVKVVYPGDAFDNMPAAPRVGALLDDTLVEGKIIDEGEADLEEFEAFEIVTGRARNTKREETMRRLREGSNYGVYAIPDLRSGGLEWLDEGVVVRMFDAAVCIDRVDIALLLACRLFVSRRHYHAALKNPAFMERVARVVAENVRVGSVVRHAMRYGFYLMLKEERLLGQKISTENRAIFDEDQFRALPIFDCLPDASPYFSAVFSDQEGARLSDTLAVYLGGRRAFTTAEEFGRRLRVMSGGMLDKIDLAKHGAFLTGSSLVPCVAMNPLEENFAGEADEFEAYLDNYYPGYTSIAAHRDAFHAEREKVSGVADISRELDDGEFMLRVVSAAGDAIPKEGRAAVIEAYDAYLKHESMLADLDVGIVAVTQQEYEVVVLKIFEEIKANVEEGGVYLYRQPTKWGFKYVLKGRAATRPIDFFKVSVQPHALLSSFHLNIVRFWWDGRVVRGLCSAVCAALTGVNQWYRWFSNNKDPMAIVLKNMQRGYTTLINHRELDVLRVYVREVDRFAYVSEKIVTGRVHRTHSLFGHEGGVRYGMEGLARFCDRHTDAVQCWDAHVVDLKRLGCSLVVDRCGRVVAPKVYAFAAMIRDQLY